MAGLHKGDKKPNSKTAHISRGKQPNRERFQNSVSYSVEERKDKKESRQLNAMLMNFHYSCKSKIACEFFLPPRRKDIVLRKLVHYLFSSLGDSCVFVAAQGWEMVRLRTKQMQGHLRFLMT